MAVLGTERPLCTGDTSLSSDSPIMAVPTSGPSRTLWKLKHCPAISLRRCQIRRVQHEARGPDAAGPGPISSYSRGRYGCQLSSAHRSALPIKQPTHPAPIALRAKASAGAASLARPGGWAVTSDAPKPMTSRSGWSFWLPCFHLSCPYNFGGFRACLGRTTTIETSF